MPHFDIIRRSEPQKSFRVATVMGTYDLQQRNVEEHFIGDIDLPEKWSIGLIVGRSGTGKTTIARELFGDCIIDGFQYTHDNIMDDMPKDVATNDIFKAFNACGFSSPPSWLKPYSVLSNGEKMRCDIARAMLECKGMFCFDEFTSVVDRDVAQIASFAIQKAIRKRGGQFVAVTCHYDVQDWLMPDWVFNTDTMTFSLIDEETQKKNRPAINLQFYKIAAHEKQYYWRIFRKYHYLSHSFNTAAHTFVCTCNGKIAGFHSALHFPHPKKKNTMIGHRLVILPDYQGVGIGLVFSNFLGEYFAQRGKKYIYTTSSPSMIKACSRSPNWRITRINRESSGSGSGLFQNKFIKGSTSCARITAGLEYRRT